jgi:hypothetical protein
MTHRDIARAEPGPVAARRSSNVLTSLEICMTRTMTLVLGAAALAALSACVEETTVSTTPTLAEQGCLRDVSAATNNPDVALLESTFSEAGTQVVVGVGPERARWRCIGYSDGTTADIMSLTDEGSL